jgi:hypothetical protein
MEFSGLITKYRANRLLTEKECLHRLKQDQRLNVEPHYQLCVIKMNSTYLESVDKWFAWKGAVSQYAIAVLVILVGSLGWLSLQWLLKAAGVMPSTEAHSVLLGSGIAMTIIVSCIAWFGIWFLRKESFAYTHYPIRFNRKSRMVHVFRTNGSVLSVPWDDVFFTLGFMPPWGDWEVRGHVLEADNITVRETFALSYVGSMSALDASTGGTNFSSHDFVRGHWEFIRRYMEDGPRALIGQVDFCMPVDGRRERFWLGVQRVLANIGGAPRGVFYMLVPWCAWVSLFRGFAMRTSKVPQWPELIEAANVIEPNDPYAIAGKASGERIAVFPDAARAAASEFIAPPSHASAATSSGLKRGLRKQ